MTNSNQANVLAIVNLILKLAVAAIVTGAVAWAANSDRTMRALEVRMSVSERELSHVHEALQEIKQSQERTEEMLSRILRNSTSRR